MSPALDQNRPAGIGAINLDPCAGRDCDRGRLEVQAALPTQKVKHDPFGVSLLARVSRRHRVTGGNADHCLMGGAGGQADCFRVPCFYGPRVVLACQLVDDLPFSAGVAPQNSRSFQGTADLIHRLSRCDAGAFGELVIVKGQGGLAEQLDDPVTMAWRRHTERIPA